jgi:hypothetical protein
MHGMLSAAIILIVFALVVAAGGGSTAWMYRAASGPSRRSRPSSETVRTAPEQTPEPAPGTPETIPDLPALPDLDAAETPPADPAPDTQGDDSGPAAVTEGPPRPALLPRAPRPALPAPPAARAAEDQAGEGDPASGETFEGARIYVLDSSRRSGR